jgi:hypothetical protein
MKSFIDQPIAECFCPCDVPLPQLLGSERAGILMAITGNPGRAIYTDSGHFELSLTSAEVEFYGFRLIPFTLQSYRILHASK